MSIHYQYINDLYHKTDYSLIEILRELCQKQGLDARDALAAINECLIVDMEEMAEFLWIYVHDLLDA